MARQSISNRYIKLESLRTLLTTKFGAGNFKIEEREESYEIDISELLTEVSVHCQYVRTTAYSQSSERNQINPGQLKGPAKRIDRMDELRNSIELLRFANKNLEGRYFIPDNALTKIFSKPAVEQYLRSVRVPFHEIEHLTKGILRGAQKCFAILILIGHGVSISGFFRRDLLQESGPDHRLPYTAEALQQIFEVETTSLLIKRFLEIQREFVIPILYQNFIFRKLDPDVILPFLREEQAGRGSMGAAWRIELHPQCHRLPLESHEIIKKELECGPNSDMEDFERELENLSLLAALDHPNIIPLYCSYIYRKRCNLIFAFADGGSLAAFLDGKQGTTGPEGSQLIIALAGLASAIDAMHNFTSEALDLSLSGCHHDLAPRNILIHGETLLLADFGLSTFRNAEDDSLTHFKEVRGSYVAPECQILKCDGHVETARIGRSSDIWSFGCILTEVLTYMTLGPEGVSDFRKARKVEVTREIIWSRFHKGPDTPNPEVSLWLDKLQANGEPYQGRLVGVIRKMLSIDPNERPRSAQVLSALRGIAILAVASPISLSLDRAHNADLGVDFILGNMRFQAWLFAFQCFLDNIDRKGLSKSDFDMTVQALKEMERVLESSGESTAAAKHQQQRLLRHQHSKLIRALPPDYRSVAKEYLVKQVLQSNEEQLAKLSTEFTETGDEDIGVLIAVKHLTALDQAGRLTEQDNLFIKKEDIPEEEHEIDIHSLAKLGPEHVLVEWLKYNESWTDEFVRTELHSRLASVVGLLHADSTTQIPGSLPCKGFFHEPSRRAFGVVHSLPFSGMQPITLHGLLDKDKSYCPLLEDRFRLAFDICQCIYTFHKVGWLHRNIHSMNVIMFPREGAGNAEWAKESRIVGFAGGRDNQLNSYTHGPDEDSQLVHYQHPEYLIQPMRYREEFDYYSVGMLLLEIGLWKPLARITRSSRLKNITNEQFRREVIGTRVPHLGVAMGTRYMEATRTCLEGGLAGESGDEEDWAETCYMSFKRLVMDRIKQFG